MGLGISTGGGNFLPYAKYDARAGRWYAKTPEGEVDITNDFTAVFDLANIEVGWLAFAAGAAPSIITAPIGEQMPAKPADNYKQGFRCVIVLNGGAAHELASTAKSLISAIDLLHTAYTEAAESGQGKLPVVKMTGTTVVETKVPGGGTTKNFSPKLEIVGWVDRPACLDDIADAEPEGVAAPGGISGPAATGSKAVPPPTAAGGNFNFG